MKLKYAIPVSILMLIGIGVTMYYYREIMYLRSDREVHLPGESAPCGEMIIGMFKDGSFECNEGVARFEFEPTSTFVCWLEQDLLNCHTGTATFAMTAPELPTPTPDFEPIPTISNEEREAMQNDEEVVYSLTTFHDCDSYSVGVSTTETLGGAKVNCMQAPNTFLITLPEEIDHISCDRSLYDGWSCGTKEQQFWFFLNS